MAEIVGTITNLSDFLSKSQVCLSVKPNDPQQQIICLEADRKYSIPAFQREVRWDDNNLKMLLYDLSRSSKFLGNIILTIKSDHTCEIIDGQQRTTVLMLLAGPPTRNHPVGWRGNSGSASRHPWFGAQKSGSDTATPCFATRRQILTE